MTVPELVKSVLEAEAFGAKIGIEPVFNLVLPRRCERARARVFPGVIGMVMDRHWEGGSVKSVVMVKAADVRRYLERNGVSL